MKGLRRCHPAARGGGSPQGGTWCGPEVRGTPAALPPTPKAPLTGSLVFDEEQLKSLLEGVLVDVELHLDPGGQAGRSGPGASGGCSPKPPTRRAPPRCQSRVSAATSDRRPWLPHPHVPPADLPTGCRLLSAQGPPGPAEEYAHRPPAWAVTAATRITCGLCGPWLKTCRIISIECSRSQWSAALSGGPWWLSLETCCSPRDGRGKQAGSGPPPWMTPRCPEPLPGLPASWEQTTRTGRILLSNEEAGGGDGPSGH